MVTKPIVERAPGSTCLLKASVGALLFLLVLGVYLNDSRVQWSGDTIPTSYLPVSILEHGSFYLDFFPSLYSADATGQFPNGRSQLPYYMERRNGHYVSGYPPWPAVLAVPLYAVPILAGRPPTSQAVLRWAKLAAAIITTLSAVLLFLALCELVSVGWAFAISVVYALGTSAFSVSSQALWQHGPSQLLLTLGLFLLVKGRKDESWLPFAGLCFSTAVLMRYTDALIALAVGLYILHKHRRVFSKYLVFSALPGLLMLAYNHWYLGSILDTGYFRLSSAAAGRDWRTPFWQGFSGLLFSPARGLFVYSPVFLLSLAGMWFVWKKGPISFRYLSVGLLLVIVVCSKWFMWWGGYCYGPRLLADIAPLFCFFLYPLCPEMSKRSGLLLGFALLAAVSFGMQAIGAYWYDGAWDKQANVWKRPDHLWSWKGSPFVYYGRIPYWDLGDVAARLGIRNELHELARRLVGMNHSSNRPTTARRSSGRKQFVPGYGGQKTTLSLVSQGRGKT